MLNLRLRVDYGHRLLSLRLSLAGTFLRQSSGGQTERSFLTAACSFVSCYRMIDSLLTTLKRCIIALAVVFLLSCIPTIYFALSGVLSINVFSLAIPFGIAGLFLIYLFFRLVLGYKNGSTGMTDGFVYVSGAISIVLSGVQFV